MVRLSVEENLWVAGAVLTTVGLMFGVLGALGVAILVATRQCILGAAGREKRKIEEATAAHNDVLSEKTKYKKGVAPPPVMKEEERTRDELHRAERRTHKVERKRVRLEKRAPWLEMSFHICVAFGFVAQLIATWLQFGSYYV